MESSFFQPNHTINASIGFEPKIWILNDRFSLGSKFGVGYKYMFGDNNNSQSSSNPNSTSSTVTTGNNSGYQLSTFGIFSLSMAFIGFIYF